jgi:hypothetical protein
VHDLAGKMGLDGKSTAAFNGEFKLLMDSKTA